MRLKRRTKVRLAKTAAKGLAEHPTMRQAATSVAVPVAKRKVRAKGRQARKYAKQAPDYADSLVQAGQQMGLVTTPAQKRTAPRVATGVVIGAAVMYFLEPTEGAARRASLVALVRPDDSTPDVAV